MKKGLLSTVIVMFFSFLIIGGVTYSLQKWYNNGFENYDSVYDNNI